MERKYIRYIIEQTGFLSHADMKEDTEEMHVLMDSLIDHIIIRKIFSSPANRKSRNGRIFNFDAFSLANGGACDLFDTIKPSLEKAGLITTSVSQIFEINEGSGNALYKFMLNNERCNLSVPARDTEEVMEHVKKKYSRFLNSLLRKKRIRERIYFMNDVSRGTELAILTPAQAKFINSLNLDPLDRPYKFSY